MRLLERGSNDLTRRVLIVSAGPYRCAVPLAHVVETMRPLPIQSLANVPPFVCGASIIRGEPVPVVDLARLLGAAGATRGRWVVVRADRRKVALAVGSVFGLEALAEACLSSVPPLLREVRPELVEALGSADEKLLMVLGTARILPDDVWETMAREHGRPA